MHGCFTTINRFEPLFLGSGAMDRWQGARGFFTTGGRSVWLWWLVVFAVLAAAAGVSISLIHRYIRARRDRAEFRRRGLKTALREEEIKLLRHMVKLAGLKRAVTIYSDEGAFGRGVTGVMRSSKVATMTEAMWANLNAMLGSMREKLGFERPEGGGSEVVSSSRQIAAGSRLQVTVPGMTGSTEAVVAGTGPSEFLVKAEAPLECRPGDVWVLRHTVGPAVWEFDAPVIRSEGRNVALRHSQKVRMLNIRRFPRVSTNMPAQVAVFPFSGGDSTIRAPEFVPATVVEIGGAGLVLKMSLETRVDERLLIVVKLNAGRLVQGVGKVRRVFADECGGRLVATELVGLNSNELAALVSETNLAATRGARENAVAEEATA